MYKLLPLLVIFLLAGSLRAQNYQPYHLPLQYPSLEPGWEVDEIAARVEKNNRVARNYSSGFSEEFSQSQAEYTAQLYRSGRIYQGIDFLDAYLDSIVALVANDSLMENYQFEARLYHGAEFNAFTLSSGKIMIYPWLIAECRNQNELATVIGHEIGHNVNCDVYESAKRHHRSEQLSAFSFWRYVTLVRAFHFDREQESQADIYAKTLLEASGLDAQSGIQFFDLLRQIHEMQELFYHVTPSENPTLFTTHPTSDQRLKEIGAIQNAPGQIESTPAFRRVRLYCRKETMKTLILEHKYEEAVMLGWRYSAQEDDQDLFNMALDATRRYIALHPEDSNSLVLPELFLLPLTSDEKFVPSELTDRIFLGSDLSTFKRPFNNQSFTFKELLNAQLNEVRSFEDCTECLLTLGLLTKDQEEREAQLADYCNSSTAFFDIGYCHQETRASLSPKKGKILLVPDKIELMEVRQAIPGVTHAKLHYLPYDEAISALRLADRNGPVGLHSKGQVVFETANHTNMNPRNFYKRQNMIRLMRILYNETCEAGTGYLVDPSLSATMHAFDIKGVDFFEISALLRKNRFAMFSAGLGLLEYYKIEAVVERIVATSDGSLEESRRLYDKFRSLHDRSLNKMFQHLYDEEYIDQVKHVVHEKHNNNEKHIDEEESKPKNRFFQNVHRILYEDGF